MSTSLNRFLIIEQGLIPGTFNFFINGGIAWWLNQHLEFMPLWGDISIGVDTLATALLLPLITCLIVSPLIAKKIKKGSLAPLALPMLNDARLPARSSFIRSLVAGSIGVVFFAVPVLILWDFLGPQQLALHDFLWFKAGFAAVLGALITALIAWWALIDASRRLIQGI